MADRMTFANARLRDAAALVIGNARLMTAHGTPCVFIRLDLFEQLLKAFNDMRELEDALNAAGSPRSGEEPSDATSGSQDA